MSGNVTAFPHPRPVLPRPTGELKPERVASLIREMIIQDELSPGDPIRERTLAERLNVSRTPLREALKILAGEGLVELQPRRGATVAAPTNREIRELLQLLGALEGFAAVLACETATQEDLAELRALQYEMMAAHARGDKLAYFHRNQEIHLALVRAARNEMLTAHHRVVNARVYRIRYVCNLRTERWASAIEEHQRILEALEQGDSDKARRILEGHVLNAWELMQQMERQRANEPA